MTKIFELLGILEIKFNELFFRLVELLYKLIVKVTPQKWKDKLHAVETKIQDKKTELKDKKEKFIIDTKEKAAKTIEWTKSKKEDGSLVTSIKEEASKIILEVKAYCLSHNYKEIFFKAIEEILIPIKWVLKKFDAYSKGQIWAGSVLSMAFLVGSFVIFDQVDKIQHTEYIHRRGPASVYQEKLGRPYYHKRDQKMYYFTHLKLPVYLKKGGKGLKKISVDFNLTTNYRKTNQYIESHYDKILDQLVMTFEPIVPEFTLKTEGKEVIRGKIKEEVNKYLKANNVEGEVTDVQIIYILGN